MGIIGDKIRESREREAKATVGQWHTSHRTGTGTVAEWSNNSEFIAAARTWEPRFRDALRGKT